MTEEEAQAVCAQLGDLPREAQILVLNLIRVHGKGRIYSEKHGRQLYLACPTCLEKDGLRELQKRHLALNIDKFFGYGKFAQHNYNRDRKSCQCMKEAKPYSVLQLLEMPELEKRGIPTEARRVARINNSEWLIDDGNGNKIPDHPGACTPITELPPEHPAVEYLRDRGFCIETLWEQFRCSFCFQEQRPGKYKRQPLGFASTPQGRIIFFADNFGIQVGWQARVIETVLEQEKYYLHPYTGQWVAAEYKVSGKWEPLPALYEDESGLEWDMRKYQIGSGTLRNDILMGLDQALTWNTKYRSGKPPLAILTEGPLDAGRFGSPGMPLLGKFMSEYHVHMVLEHFGCAVYAGQNDEVGRSAALAAETHLAGKIPFAKIFPAEGIKDWGDMSTLGAMRILYNIDFLKI